MQALPTTPRASNCPVELHPITAPTEISRNPVDPHDAPLVALATSGEPAGMTAALQNLSNLHLYRSEGTSVIRATISLIPSCLGVGSLTIPYSFARLGLIIGLLLLVITGALSTYTIYILVKLMNRTRCTTFVSLGEKFFGYRGKIIVAILIILMLWGFGAVYVLVIYELLTPMAGKVGSGFLAGYWGGRLATVLFWAVFMMPLTMMRSLAKVNTAILSPIGISFIIFAMIMRIQDSGLPFSTNIVWGPLSSLEIVQSITDIKLLFGGQVVVFAIYTSLADQHTTSMFKFTGAGFSIAGVLYLLLGIVGLAAFGENAAGNVLMGFPDPMGTWYVIMAYVAILFTFSVAYLMLMYPTRDAVLALMGHPDPMEVPNRTQRLVTAALGCTTMLAGLFVPGLNLMIGIVGGLFATAVNMIIPVVFAIRSGTWTVERVGYLQVILVWFILAYGALSGPLGAAVSVYLTIVPPSTSLPASVAAPNATLV